MAMNLSFVSFLNVSSAAFTSLMPCSFVLPRARASLALSATARCCSSFHSKYSFFILLTVSALSGGRFPKPLFSNAFST